MAASEHALTLAQVAAGAAEDKLAADIVAFDVSERLPLSDVFLLASAPNDRQVQAIVDIVEERLHAAGAKPLRREGNQQGRWVLIDFGDLVVHVQHEEERLYYQLERLWRDCPVVPLRLGPNARDAGAEAARQTVGGPRRNPIRSHRRTPRQGRSRAKRRIPPRAGRQRRATSDELLKWAPRPARADVRCGPRTAESSCSAMG